MSEPEVNWVLLAQLGAKPHPRLPLAGTLADTDEGPGSWVGGKLRQARAVQHLCDLAGVPSGKLERAAIDARVFLLMMELFTLRDRLERLADWHSRMTGPSGTFDDYCVECSERWPCDTRRMAEGTYRDEEGL